MSKQLGQRLKNEECLTEQEQIHQKVARREARRRLGPTVLTHHADSSLEAQCQCPAAGHETGYDEDVIHQVGSSVEA